MASVAINAPKTPVTKGSNTVAVATVPNVCKMPGPPAPFVPTPLPNIGRSALSPKKFSKKVKIEGHHVGIQGSTFASQGDIASKGTGGGLVSANTHGITKFIGPGSMNVKIEGKRVQLLGDPMLNNCGPSGSPPNAATMTGAVHVPVPPPAEQERLVKCAVKECDEMAITQKHRARMKKSMTKAKKKGKSPGTAACRTLGTIKHECVQDKLEQAPGARCERTYDMRQDPPTVFMRKRKPNEECSNFWSGMAAAFRACGGRCNYKKGDAKRPDVVFGPEPGSKNVYDAKFPCNASVSGGNVSGSPIRSNQSRSGKQMMCEDQKRDYKKIASGGKVKAIAPKDARNANCADTPWS